MKPDYATVGMVLASIFVLLQAALVVLSIWEKLKRKPSIDQTLLYYVRREEYAEHVKRNDDITKELFTLLRNETANMASSMTDLKRDLGEWQRGMAYQIGSMDGRMDKIERKPPK